MDLNSMMSNPAAQQMMGRLMSDPELMALIQQPGIMAKLQAVMQDPSSAMQYMSDPDFAVLLTKLQSLQMQDPGTSSAYSSNPWSSSSTSSATIASALVDIHSKSQFEKEIATAGKKLVVAYFTASWCGPCKKISPVYSELAETYNGKVVFLKIDGDANRNWIMDLGITSYPTFHFMVSGNKVDSLNGADENRLRSIVREYGDREDVIVCPYVHFPIKDTEIVKYADMKWDVVESKLAEYNSKLTASSNNNALDEKESAECNVIIQKLQNKSSYHTSTFTDTQYAVVTKMLQWPSECLGPVLNFIRILVLHPHAAQKYSREMVDKKTTSNILTKLLQICQAADKPVTSMLILRIICNMFSRRVCMKAMGERVDDVIDAATATFKRFEDDNCRQSVCAVFINYSVLFYEDQKYFEAGKIQILSAIVEAIGTPLLSSQVVYRFCIIVGTLVYNDANTAEMARDMEVLTSVSSATGRFPTDKQLQEVANELTQVLKPA